MCLLVAVVLARTAFAQPQNTTPDPRPQPRVVGQRPPALAPFAENDPIPKLSLVPHPQQNTPRQAAESFLAHLSKGYSIPGMRGGEIIGGEANGYDLAWSFMGPNRPALSDFKRGWEGTVATKVIQLEPSDDTRFFVEFERVQRCADHWAVSFYHGVVDTVKTPEGWRVQDLRMEPDNLVGTNIAGHQGWQQDEEYMAKWSMSPQEEQQPWVVQGRRYARRTVTLHLRHAKTGETRIIRLARTLDGSWEPLSVRPDTGVQSSAIQTTRPGVTVRRSGGFAIWPRR